MSKLTDELSSHDGTMSPFPRILASLSDAADILSMFINVNNLDMHGLKARWNRNLGFNPHVQFRVFLCFCISAVLLIAVPYLLMRIKTMWEIPVSLYVEKNVARAIAGGLQTLTSTHSASSVTDPSAAPTLSATYGA